LKVIEHLDGRSYADDQTLRELHWSGLLDLPRLLTWLRREPMAGCECEVNVGSEEVGRLMRPCGVNGGRVGR